MSRKHVRRALDAAMSLFIVLLMGYAAFGELFHEIAGVLVGALFVVHHWVNRAALKSLFKGRYSLKRVYDLSLLLASFVVVGLQLFSGIFLSRRLFSFLEIEGFAETSRILHMTLAYWGFVLLALHAGANWRAVVGKLPENVVFKAIFLFSSAGIFLYGLYAFVHRRFITYLFKRSAFAFFDYDEAPARVFFEYVAVFCVFCTIGGVASSFLRRVASRPKNARRDVQKN